MEKIINTIIEDDKKRENLEKRFWPKVRVGKAEDCWEWISKAKHPYGYGRMSAGRKVNLKAHQISWALHNGKIPAGMLVLHSCDNPSCCNPNHLSVGTQSQNMADAKSRGRSSSPPILRGKSHPMAKLSDEQITMISLDLRPAEIVAEEYGVSSKTIYRVRWGIRKKEHG